MAEMVKTTREYCMGCIYSTFESKNSTSYSCDYLCMTGKRRGCKVGECDKFVARTSGSVKRFNQNTFVPYFKKGNENSNAEQ